MFMIKKIPLIDSPCLLMASYCKVFFQNIQGHYLKGYTVRVPNILGISGQIILHIVCLLYLTPYKLLL